MKNELNMNTSVSSLLMISIIVGLVIGMFVFGKVVDTCGIRSAFTVFLIGSALVVYLFKLPIGRWSVSPVISLIVIDLLIGFFLESAQSGIGLIVSRLYPTEVRTTANSLVNGVATLIGGGGMSILISFLMDRYSLTGVIVSISILAVVNLMIMLTVPGLKKLS